MPVDPEETKFLNTAFDDMSWPQKIEFVQRISLYPALTLLVPLRTMIGFRLLKTTRLLTMTAIMIIVGLIAGSMPLPFGPMIVLQPRHSDGAGLILYAVAFLVAGLWQQRQRWNDIKRGVVWHTYHEGISRFSFLPLPQHIIRRYVDPFAITIIGILILIFSRPLGFWLIYSAVFLMIFENARHEKRLERDLDAHDALWDAQLQKENLRHFGGHKAASTPRRQVTTTTSPIPTGLTPDIQALIKRRSPPSAPIEETSETGGPFGSPMTPA